MSIYLGLVHYPIKNKNGEEITTSVTNLDIHDISRSCRTYGLEKYYIITPVLAQHELLNKILGHWQEDKASAYNPDRFDALAKTTYRNSIDDAIADITEKEGKLPKLVVTGANFESYSGTCVDLMREVNIDKSPIFIVFGTGWGLSASIVDRADFSLEPIFGDSKDGYNHLSVRSAVAIYLDRLASAKQGPLNP